MYRSSTFLRIYRCQTVLYKRYLATTLKYRKPLCVPYHTVVLKGLMRSGGGAVFCSCRETGFSLLGRLVPVRNSQPVITKYRQVPTYLQCKAADMHHFCESESVFHCNAVPDPIFHHNLDLDPAPHHSYGHWSTDPLRFHCGSTVSYGSILSL
jgi:hypothetical protein